MGWREEGSDHPHCHFVVLVRGCDPWGPHPFSRPCVCLVHQVIVHEVPGQELEVEVYDKDPDQDDFLGRYMSTHHVSKNLCHCLICHPSGGVVIRASVPKSCPKE